MRLVLRFDAIQSIVGGGDNNPQKKGVVLETAKWRSGTVQAMSTNPYFEFVQSIAAIVAKGKSLPLGDIQPPQRTTTPAAEAPVALIFSPHPDDECIIGGLALRLMREAGMRVINIAVTLGRDKNRQSARLQELKNACEWLGFGLEVSIPNGLEKINPKTHESDSQYWAQAVTTIAAVLAKHRPSAIFFPHELDWNSTHIGTHFLIMDALKTLPPSFHTLVMETEFWGQMSAPNLMVESSAKDVGDLLGALSFHVGEVQRNPYHLRMPAWLIDNVRRGAELVGGQGSSAPDFTFATLYRARQWKNGQLEELYSGGRQIGLRDFPGSIFGLPGIK